MNINYPKLYQGYVRHPVCLEEDGLVSYVHAHLYPFYTKELEALFRAKYPRRRKLKLNLLAGDEIKLMRQKYRTTASKMFKHLIQAMGI